MSVTTTLVRRSGWRSVWRSTSLMLWQAAPWVLVVLVVMSVLGVGFTSWSTWSGARHDDRFIVQGDGGVAAGVSVFVGLAALFSWMSTVRTALPVLVAGGVTRRAATGGLLVATLALAVVTTAVLAAVAVAGAALRAAWYRWRTRGVIGVLVVLGVVWSACVGIVAAVPADAAALFAASTSPGAPFVGIGICLVLAAAVWLVLRRVPLRPPAG